MTPLHVNKLLRMLAAAYAVYTLVILVVAVSNFFVFFAAARANAVQGTSPSAWVPLVTFAVIATICVTLAGLLSYFLAVRRRRKVALAIAALTCIGFPIGTILGGITIYALMRPDVQSDFGQTI
jgi:hypothetical protein